MPLKKSKSKAAFVENLKTELEAGKPKKQALAIAYATQRAAGGKPARAAVKGSPTNKAAKMPKRKKK